LLNFLDIGNIQRFSGLMLLISGGSFLNVATMHILPEVLGDSHSSNSLKTTDLIILVGTMYIPVLLSVDHSH
jgi:hypothetical protein